jgi:cell wall-associated NlpC family hydrolase
MRIEPADVVIAALAADGSAALRTPTTFVLDEQTGSQTKSATFELPDGARARLAALEAAGNMPSADADLRMWGSSDAAMSTTKRADQFGRFARGIISRTSSIAMSLTRSAMRFIGTPYVFGGTSPSGFDCSGYTQHVFAMLGISLPRTADAQYYAGKPTVGGMQMGDLVFFQTYLPGPSHVGIYLGSGKFISSSGHGVMVSSLSDRYWAARYIGAKRVVALR